MVFLQLRWRAFMVCALRSARVPTAHCCALVGASPPASAISIERETMLNVVAIIRCMNIFIFWFTIWFNGNKTLLLECNMRLMKCSRIVSLTCDVDTVGGSLLSCFLCVRLIPHLDLSILILIILVVENICSIPQYFRNKPSTPLDLLDLRPGKIYDQTSNSSHHLEGGLTEKNSVLK